MNTVCFYHDNCPDGFTAAWVVSLANEGCRLVPVQYGQPLPPAEVYDGKDVYIVDFSYPPAELAVMAEKAKSIVMLDHHASAIDRWNGQPFVGDGVDRWWRGDDPHFSGQVRVWFDTTQSGAKLAWSRLFPDEYAPPLVRYIQDRDLWQWQLPDSRAISAYIGTVHRTLSAWDELSELLMTDDGRRLAATIGGSILAANGLYVDAVAMRAVRWDMGHGVTVPVVNTTHLHSEVGERLNRGEVFSVTYFDDLVTGKRRFSLRSDKDSPTSADVSKIAQGMGGGGHKHAAGFEAELGVSFEGVAFLLRNSYYHVTHQTGDSQ